MPFLLLFFVARCNNKNALAASASAMRDYVVLLVLAALLVTGIVNAADGSPESSAQPSGGGVAWRIPVPPGREGCGDREAAGSCVTVPGGDSAALLAALSDSGVDEIWLAGGVSLPQGGGVLHLERDLLLGGLKTPLTPLHFEAGDGEPLLVMHGFLALVNLKITGLASFRQSLGPGNSYHVRVVLQYCAALCTVLRTLCFACPVATRRVIGYLTMHADAL